jgi:hypothetical protein
MTPIEKAVELVNKFYGYIIYENESVYSEKMLRVFKIKAKNCALIAVDEIINSDPLEPNDAEEWLQPADWFSEANISAEKYWNEVKNEINKL